MSVQAQHLHTYFLFPFSIDTEGVRETHEHIWKPGARWIDGIDEWISKHQPSELNVPWKRAPYTQFDLQSRAYQDMVFFHPIVRRVFFDTTGQEGSREALLHCYTMQPPPGEKLYYECSDNNGGSASVQITDLRLFLFANGIGILSVGVEAWNVPVAQALWINEAMRKVYPSSGRQIREGRSPDRSAIVLAKNETRTTLVEDIAGKGTMIGFQPPLSETIQSLIYFADYSKQEFEPVLDERMIVYTYVEFDPASIPEGYKDSEDYQILLSRLLYVEEEGETYRYEVNFLRERMKQHLYTRWAHEGTYYGFSSYSSITTAIGTFDCGAHQVAEGFLIHRMFDTRYYLMAMVALFYRAALLDFTERAALVSRRLYQQHGRTLESIQAANDLRSEFLHFYNYWHFDELANKEEEQEHFELQCRFYRIPEMKQDIDREVDALGRSLQDHYQFRNTEAINRVAMLSLILGIGAMVTGFYGMNFGRGFSETLFEPKGDFEPLYYIGVISALVIFFGVLAFCIYVVIVNWTDYKDILNPHHRKTHQRSLRRDS